MGERKQKKGARRAGKPRPKPAPRRPAITIRVPVTVWVPVPIFAGGARFNDLDEWAKSMGWAIDLRPVVQSAEPPRATGASEAPSPVPPGSPRTET